MKLSSITPSRLFNAIRTMLLIPPALIARCFRPAIWIITERPDQARDNGYCFFKYLKEYHPEQPAYYIIDRNSTNHVYIDGKMIPPGQEIALQDYAEIQLADEPFVFQVLR